METITILTPKQAEEIFIKNLVFLRGKLSQEQFSSILNVKRSRLGAWEERRAFPHVFYCQKIAKHFNKTVEEMMSIEFYLFS